MNLPHFHGIILCAFSAHLVVIHFIYFCVTDVNPIVICYNYFTTDEEHEDF